MRTKRTRRGVEEDADEEGDVVVVEEVDLALRDVLFKN